MQIYVTAFGQTNPDVAMCRYSIGNTFGDLGRHEEALAEKQAAMQIYVTAFGTLHRVSSVWFA